MLLISALGGGGEGHTQLHKQFKDRLRLHEVLSQNHTQIKNMILGLSLITAINGSFNRQGLPTTCSLGLNLIFFKNRHILNHI